MSGPTQVTIYTDGAAGPTNTGPAGYGVVLECNGRRKELSGGYRVSTNNRMELMAAIVGLEMLKGPCEVTIYSDSTYVVNAVERGWFANWRDSGWAGDPGRLNMDLWQQFRTVYSKRDVTMLWVPAHTGNVENERCDRLAKWTARRRHRPVDEGYAATQKKPDDDLPVVVRLRPDAQSAEPWG